MGWRVSIATLQALVIGQGKPHDQKCHGIQGPPHTGRACNRSKHLALVDGIKYQRVDDEHYLSHQRFERKELTGYLNKNMLENTKRSVFEHVVYDSGGVEQISAEQMEMNDAVKVYAKLPSWFKVPAPLGS